MFRESPKIFRRVEACLFLTAWIGYAYFHQGGGWTQNARFAMARAAVEQGTFALDSFLFYSSVDTSEGRRRLERTEFTGGGFDLRGRHHTLVWPGGQVAIEGGASGERPTQLDRVACTAEVTYAQGHFHPRLAPGTALLALPAYLLLHQAEQLAGYDPNELWIFTINAWLTTALSVGLISALGCVIFFRITLLLWDVPPSRAVCATLAFAFATIYFPNATMLYAENVVAVALLAAFYCLVLARRVPAGKVRRTALAAGAASGVAVICAYAAVFPVGVLLSYLLAKVRPRRAVIWFACGLSLPLLLGGAYHWASFGSPLLTAFQFPHMMAHEPEPLWAQLGVPQPMRLVALLVSPFRGLFFTAPVLLAALPGLWVMARDRARRAEAGVAIAILVVYLLLAAGWREWHGGWGFGPRSLVPALPFLALGLTFAFMRAWRTTTALAVASAAIMTLVTAVDAQPAVGVSAKAAVSYRPTFLREPLSEYILPVFVTGRADAILQDQVRTELEKIEEKLEKREVPEGRRTEELRLAELSLARSLEMGDGRFALASYLGPVSANPTGMFEPWPMHLFTSAEPELRWQSFNAGELIWPRSRASLLPVLILCLALACGAVVLSRG